MEAGEYGLKRGTCFVASRLEVVAVAGLLWISWCVLGGAGFSCVFVFFRYLYVQIRRARAVSVDSVKGPRQPAHMPTVNSRTRYPPGLPFVVLPLESHSVS